MYTYKCKLLAVVILLQVYMEYTVGSSEPRVRLENIDALDLRSCGYNDLRYWMHSNAFCVHDELRSKNRHSNHSSRLAAAGHAQLGWFPSFAAVLFMGQDDIIISTCGGVIIHKNLVLTAAHCIIGTLRECARANIEICYTEIRVGSVLLDSGVHTKYVAAEYVIHPDVYSPADPFEKTRNDIAIIRTVTDIGYNAWVRPACINLDRLHRQSAICYAVGHGQSTQWNTHSNALRFLEMKRNCHEGPYPDEHLHEEDVTVGTSCYKAIARGSTCSGDSGGPMYCADSCRGNQNQAYVVGVLSVAVRITGQNGLPGCVADDNLTSSYFADIYKLQDVLPWMLESFGGGGWRRGGGSRERGAKPFPNTC